MKHATTITKTKVAKVKAELKTIRTADVNPSVTLPRRCHWSDKLSVLFKLHHAWRTYSYFQQEEYYIFC